MTDATDWIAEARRRIDAGERILDVARDLGVDDRHLRHRLNINGAADKQKARVCASRERERAERTGVRPKAKGQRSVVAISDDRVSARAYADPAPARPLTLPKISLPDLDEPPLIRRFAPPPRMTVSEGAERIRQIHLSMKRRGLIPERSDLVDHFTH